MNPEKQKQLIESTVEAYEKSMFEGAAGEQLNLSLALRAIGENLIDEDIDPANSSTPWIDEEVIEDRRIATRVTKGNTVAEDDGTEEFSMYAIEVGITKADGRLEDGDPHFIVFTWASVSVFHGPLGMRKPSVWVGFGENRSQVDFGTAEWDEVAYTTQQILEASTLAKLA